MNHISNVEAAWLAFVVIFPVALYLLFSGYQTRQRMSVRKAVIDKFTSAEDFAAFLQSAAGQRFITDLSGLESPAGTMIRAVPKGVILILLGGGMWWAGKAIESKVELVSIGVLLICVGAGILISAGISYRLAKSWGLINRFPSNDRESEQGSNL